MDIPEPEEGTETEIADGISMVKGETGETVILTGFGLYLGKKASGSPSVPAGAWSSCDTGLQPA